MVPSTMAIIKIYLSFNGTSSQVGLLVQTAYAIQPESSAYPSQKYLKFMMSAHKNTII